MSLSRERFEQRNIELAAQIRQVENQLHALSGAKQLNDSYLAEFDRAEQEAKQLPTTDECDVPVAAVE